GNELDVIHLHTEFAHEGGEDREAGVARRDGDAAALDLLDLGGTRRIRPVYERHRALLEGNADRLDWHPGADATHHRRGIHVGDGVGRVGDQLGNRGGATALEDLDVETFILVEALIAG